MSEEIPNSEEYSLPALSALADQVQSACDNSGVGIAGFLLVSADAAVEMRTVLPYELMVKLLRATVEELEREQD